VLRQDRYRSTPGGCAPGVARPRGRSRPRDQRVPLPRSQPGGGRSETEPASARTCRGHRDQGLVRRRDVRTRGAGGRLPRGRNRRLSGAGIHSRRHTRGASPLGAPRREIRFARRSDENQRR